VADNWLNCPFCDGDELAEVMNDCDVSMECLNCHATGPYVNSIDESAREAWNSRHPDTTHIVEDPDYDNRGPLL